MKRLALVLAMSLAACVSDTPEPPSGQRSLPDLAPLPPVEFTTALPERGLPRRVQFTATLVNVGEGDFLLGAERDGGLLSSVDAAAWSVVQLIEHTAGGVEEVPVDAELVYGGDGHEHWHVRAIARYWLEPIDARMDREESPVDSKIGFCFFDFSVHDPDLADNTDQATYTSDGCGGPDDRRIDMGLSRGWGDVYQWYLEGQYIDLTGLGDGTYRLWGEVDPEGWFVERTTDNNRTWSDIRLRTREADGAPVVELVGTAS